MNAARLVSNRILASTAKWGQGERWALVDPTYYGDLLNATTLTSSDYVPEGTLVGGQLVNKRMGWNILEDNSAGLLSLSPAAAGADVGLFFDPDFLILVQQLRPQFEVSSLHGNKQFGFIISVKGVVGASLGNDGDVKHILNYAT